MDTSLVASFCDEDRFNNAFYILKKTVDFLSTEYGMHFVILSAYQSSKAESVAAAYTSPGPAAKFFDDKHSKQTDNNNSTNSDPKNKQRSSLVHTWDEFAKNFCFQDKRHSYHNTPAYSEFIKSDLNDNSLGSGANCEAELEMDELPEPPSRLCSETMYYCNGEFKSEDIENSHSPNSDSGISGDEDTKRKSDQRTKGLKRKSLQDVSDQLAKKATRAMNYYTPVYPAAPKLVTPSFATNEALLNLSNALLRNTTKANANASELDFSAIKPLLNSVSNIFTQSAAASAYAALAQQHRDCSIFGPNVKSEPNAVPSSVITANRKSSAGLSSPEISPFGSSDSPLQIHVDSKPTKVPSRGKNSDKKNNTRAPPSPMKGSSALNANGTPKQMWPCTVCSKEFASQSTMKRHLNHFHLKVHSYTCTYCQEIFYRKDKLVAHIKIKHGVDTSRSARLVTQAKTSPNGSYTTNSTISPVSPATSHGSPTSSAGNMSTGTASLSPVPSPSPSTCVVQPMTPPSFSPSPAPSPLSLTVSSSSSGVTTV